MDWGILLALIPSLLQMLFGGTDEAQKQETTGTTTTTALPSGYQSPTLGLQDLLMQAALGKNLNIYGGAGLPKGQTIAPDFLQDFLGLIGSSYTDLQKKYTNPTTTTATTDPVDKARECVNHCSPYGIPESPAYKTCYNQCISRGL